MDMLQRNIHVPRHFGAIGDRLDQFIRPMRRMRVEQTNPKIAGHAFNSRSSVQIVVASAGRDFTAAVNCSGEEIARLWLARKSNP